jgi:uncharacterized protein
MQIELRGQSLQLLAQRAVLWLEKKTLIVSDIHLGKVSAMQNVGIAVPEGTMDNDLQNLKVLVERTKAEKCIIVGDLIHSKNGLSGRVKTKFKEWLSNVDCGIELVIGNHDRALIKQVPEGWNLHVHKEHLLIEPFCFSHYPRNFEEYFVWSGHIHPQFLIKSRHDQLTLRCFHVSENQGILPAFSDFVGGAYVKKEPRSKVYIIAHDTVIEI